MKRWRLPGSGNDGWGKSDNVGSGFSGGIGGGGNGWEKVSVNQWEEAITRSPSSASSTSSFGNDGFEDVKAPTNKNGK